MAEFEDRQAALDEARKRAKATQRELFATREKQRKVHRSRDGLTRHAGDDATNARIEELEAESKKLDAAIGSLKGLSAEHVQLERDQLTAFLPFSDPTQNISRLDDRYPILLFPVRLETRFKEAISDDVPVNQLWVRVYPDDIAVDTFEEMLAEVEVSNARIYWTNIWKAGGVEGEKRAAWQSLVKSHGAGRAFWIIEQVVPENRDKEPSKDEGEFLLIVVTESPLPEIERQPVRDYWRDTWLANSDPDKIDTAFTALVLALGQARAAVINEEYVPQNLETRPQPDPDVVRVEFLEMPSLEDIETQQQPWMHAANTALLPERFVLLGFNDGGEGPEQTLFAIGNPVPSELVIGPNPAAEPEDQMHLDGDELVVPDELKWMVDFEEALSKGMGFRVNLSESQARLGFDRLFVLGVRLSADIEKSQEQLEQLITNHQRSRKGFSLLPQGAPTNNVEDEVSGYTWRADSDESYDHFFTEETPGDPSDWRLKKDGRWLAEFLGVKPKHLKAAPNYYSTDQCEARAMHMALWPATLGPFMEQQMEPVFSDGVVNATREFFTRYVVGRGAIPAIRVGNQPYGILPATPFSRMGWLTPDRRPDDSAAIGPSNQFQFLSRLYELILEADKTWSELVNQVSYVGKPGVDPQQALLDVVGLHPSSVEFYQRYAETLEQLYNRLKFSSELDTFTAFIVALSHALSGTQLLSTLGYDSQKSGLPDVLNKFFLREGYLLKGPVIDDRALSENEAIRAYRDDGDNYIQWLIDAARDSHNTLRMQDGFIDDRPPTALLYLMLHHALDASFVDTSLQLHLSAEVFDKQQVIAARRQPNFVHIQEPQEDSGSHYQYLYKTEPRITDSQTLSIADYIPRILVTLNPYLNRQLGALEHLQHVPTARLERAFVEHLDCCSSRLDAWWLGLVNVQLELMRNAVKDGEEGVARGSYLGAFGWLEDVRSENKVLEPVQLDEQLNEIFNKEGQAPLVRDSENFGHVHAPSLNHAVTAAVLRNGYLSNATPANPESLAINLTSERVRLAMGVIEGIRNGQSLAALLGYQFERGLHDAENLFLDSLIFEFRREFPLAGNRLSTTTTDDDVSIEAIEARNVVDGLKLVEHVQAQSAANQSYPFGLSGTLPEVSETDKLDAINAQVQRIMNINDAAADLAMAESVYQVVQGNYDRAAGTLEAYSKGNFPPTPEVVQTPRSGVVLTHRVGLHFQSNLNPGDPAHTTPRAVGEPAINDWLKSLLPDAGDVYCEVEFFDHGLSAVRTEEITADDLGLLPVDLLYMANMDGEQQMKALDDRILFHVIDTIPTVRPDAQVKIRYRVRKDPMISFFELAPYLRNLRALILRSRPLRPTDVRLPNEADAAEEATAQINTAKITLVKDKLVPLRDDVDALFADLETLLQEADPDVLAANAVAQIDTLIDRYTAAANAISLFGLPGAGVAFALDWRRQQFGALLRKLVDYIARWQDRRDRFDLFIDDYDNLDLATAPQQKFDLLLKAGRLIWTETLVPLPADPDELRDDLVGPTKRGAFINVLGTLETLRDGAMQLTALFEDVRDEAPNIAQHDLEAIDLAPDQSAIVAFAGELKAKAESLKNDLNDRIAKAEELLVGDPEAGAAKRIEELTQASRRLLGEEFVVLPDFELTAEQGAEWENAHDNKDKLLEFLKSEENIDFPVDDWLYGVARVREKLHHLESATMLADALKGKEIELEPLQFPYRDPDAWLALKFPDKKPGTEEPFVIDEDKLLYTAHYHGGFANTLGLKHCGVLVDDWTEVIPTTEETTGLAFHYDRPNTEPAQTLLLATPADFSGEWAWQDLVDTLHETLDLAKKRAVEPAHIDSTAYARFLPTILSEVARFPITTSLNYAFNNEIQYTLEL